MNFVTAFNAVEVVLWGTLSLATFCLGHRIRGLTPATRVWLGATFLAFSLSDVLEVKTGAWWRPPGLLVLKGTCLLCFAVIGWRLWRNRQRGAA